MPNSLSRATTQTAPQIRPRAGKILLISPSKDPGVKKPGFLMIPQLALHLIAGLTPPRFEVKIVEEEIQPVDLEEHCGLVGISCMTSNSTRAYALAREFRKRGRTVVLGGVHPTLLPDEALQHADAVVVGEAEGVWEQLLEDWQAGALRRRYHVSSPSLDRYVAMGNRRQTRKRLFDVLPVMTTRGCPYNCDFCCVHDIFGRRVRHVPIANVVRDIESSGGRIFIFLDDNIIGDPGYARQLFQAIKPLRIRWVGQASLSFVKDTELIRLASDSGCAGLFFGLESVSPVQLARMRKSIKEVSKVGEAIRKVKEFGIYFHGSLIFGFDSDTLDSFPETLDFLERNRISSASINVLTPYPGTEVFRKLKAEGRLLTEQWSYYDHSTTVFQPRNMSPFQLQAGRLWVLKEFTKISAVLRRLPAHLDHPLLHLAMNLGFWAGCRKDLDQLPALAAGLFPGDQALESARPRLTVRGLRGIRVTDFLPRRAPGRFGAS
jgi:radical SAM superfamily enzyme YgiQ (UPF0313 family)